MSAADPVQQSSGHPALANQTPDAVASPVAEAPATTNEQPVTANRVGGLDQSVSTNSAIDTDAPPWNNDDTGLESPQPPVATPQIETTEQTPPAATEPADASQVPPASLTTESGTEAHEAAPSISVQEAPTPAVQPISESPQMAPVAAAPDLSPLASEPTAPAEAQLSSAGLSPDQMSAMGLQSARTIDAPAQAPAAQPQLAKVALSAADSTRWIEIYAGLGVGGVLQSTVSNCLLQQINGNQFYFLLDHNHSTLYDPAHQARLADLLSRYFEQSIEAFIELGTVTAETPAACAIRIKQEQYSGALQAMHQDPLVQQLLQQFEGELDQESVQAILPE